MDETPGDAGDGQSEEETLRSLRRQASLSLPAKGLLSQEYGRPCLGVVSWDAPG
jgi:hypothetical protein